MNEEKILRVNQARPLLGWRFWLARREYDYIDKEWEYRLGSTSHRCTWSAWEPMEAFCLSIDYVHNIKLAPRIDCRCGLFAYKMQPTVDEQLNAIKTELRKNRGFSFGDLSGMMVVGTVELWGRVIEGQTYYRAKYARPTSLCVIYVPGMEKDGPFARGHEAAAFWLAKWYRVPVKTCAVRFAGQEMNFELENVLGGGQ